MSAEPLNTGLRDRPADVDVYRGVPSTWLSAGTNCRTKLTRAARHLDLGRDRRLLIEFLFASRSDIERQLARDLHRLNLGLLNFPDHLSSLFWSRSPRSIAAGSSCFDRGPLQVLHLQVKVCHELIQRALGIQLDRELNPATG